MVRYLIVFGYIGTKYKGLQMLPKFVGETIQGIIEDGLKTLNPLNHPKTITCSRTDKGVHAIKNAIHVDLEHPMLKETFHPHKITENLNFYLQDHNHDIVINKTCIVSDTFHARYPVWRSYIYRIALLKPSLKEFSLNFRTYSEYLPLHELNRCWIIHGSLDIEKIQEASKLLLGMHDFRTFSSGFHKEKKDPIRTILDFDFYPVLNQNFLKDPKYENVEIWEFYIRGESFLYHQIRKMVGALISLGYGFLSFEVFQKMVNQPLEANWVQSLFPPACGLYLAEVHYDKLNVV